MNGFWAEERWKIHGDCLVLPSGQLITLERIRHELGERMMGNADLRGHWSGWRVRQQFLIAPGGTMRQGRIAEHVMKHLVQVNDIERIAKNRRQGDLFHG